MSDWLKYWAMIALYAVDAPVGFNRGVSQLTSAKTTAEAIARV